MSKRKSIKIGNGELCPKCKNVMECRESTKEKPYYRQFDYCNKCRHIQFYPKVDKWLKKKASKSHGDNAKHFTKLKVDRIKDKIKQIEQDEHETEKLLSSF